MSQKLISVQFSYNIVCQSKIPTDEQIHEQHLKYIAEITKDYDHTTIQSERLNDEQQQWLRRRMLSAMGEPWKSWSKREK